MTKQEDKIAQDLAVKEFESLRSEILGYQAAENQSLLGLLAATAVIGAAALQQHSVAVLLVLPLLTFAIGHRVHAMRMQTVRVGSFLQVFYEENPQRAGATWERALYLRRRRTAATPPASLLDEPMGSVSPATNALRATLFGVLATGCLVGAWNTRSAMDEWPSLLALLTVSAVVTPFVWYKTEPFLQEWELRLKEWRGIQDNLCPTSAEHRSSP